ncbi:hypothetical protein MERGE_003054 [Pneumocystis wakefieldiae]|uniref:ARID domain-containing protein n=1 Tax=Pneumocystis wakefieldiae TaxID=38082 RepID=A0A899GBF6_9ASCO|nr:hypothetical protein MERGE_003054 [Pneumocystis wakefieldiae]
MGEIPLDSAGQFNNDLMYTGWTTPIYEQQLQPYSMFLPGRETDITRTDLVYPAFSKPGQTNTKYIQMHGLLPGYGTQSFSGPVGPVYVPSSTNAQMTVPINTLSTINMPINNVMSCPISTPINAPISTPINAPISTPINAPISTPINTPINSITSFQPTPSTIASPQTSAQSLSASSALIQPSFYPALAYSPLVSIQQGMPGTQTLSGRASTTVNSKPNTIDSLMASLIEFMNKRGISINSHPYIGDQQINLALLYIQVMRLGGSYKVTQANAWGSIAHAFGINLTLIPNAGQQLAECYKNYLALYEEAWIYNQQLLMQKQAISNNYKHGIAQEKNEKNTNYNTNNALLHFQAQHVLPSKSISQPVSQPILQQISQPVSQPILQQISQPVSQPILQQISQPVSQPKLQQISQPVSQPKLQQISRRVSQPKLQQMSRRASQSTFTQRYKPKKRIIDTYGGFDLKLITRMANDLENLRCKPPALHELGTINIYALTMSIQSRLHSEVNRALDVLTIITGDKRWSLPLLECDELLDSIIEMADEEYQLLIPDVKNADETISISSYEQMVDLYYDEIDDLTTNYRPGSQGYIKFRSMEKILCITTILRNLTFAEENQNIMAKNNALLILIEHLIILISKTNITEISCRQRLDLAKDLIILLSNISQDILIDNDSTAIAIICLITAFSPDSNICLNPDKIIFIPYNPTLHPYLPAAIDTLAKLFARSFPNRHTFAKIMIFLSSKQCLRDNVFIRALMLCISPIPISTLTHPVHTCEARLALLEHCTLAAEAIINIFPKEDNLAQSILLSDNIFLGNFVRLACLLSSIGGGRLQNQIHNIESNPFSRFARRTMNILRILIEKAKEEKPLNKLNHIISTIPKKEQLLGSLLTPHMDGMIIKNLWSLVEGNCAKETQ